MESGLRRYNFTHQQWLFLSELEVLGNPSSTGVSIDPPSAFLYAGSLLSLKCCSGEHHPAR